MADNLGGSGDFFTICRDSFDMTVSRASEFIKAAGVVRSAGVITGDPNSGGAQARRLSWSP